MPSSCELRAAQDLHVYAGRLCACLLVQVVVDQTVVTKIMKDSHWDMSGQADLSAKDGAAAASLEQQEAQHKKHEAVNQQEGPAHLTPVH